MSKTFICKNCKTEKSVNPRLKGKQQYCGATECQRARKTAWQRAKMKNDREYRESQQQSKKNWRLSKPADRYQDEYRGTHPKYVKSNREKQRLRNQLRRNRMIVKMDALTDRKPATYIMTPCEKDASGKIVKMDALLVQLQRCQWNPDLYHASSHDCKDGPY